METIWTQESHGRDVAAGAGPFAATAQNTLLMRVLDEIDYGLLLVTTDGALRYANQLGLREVRAAGALQLVQGRVQARHAGDQGALHAALADARRGLRRLVTTRHEGTPVCVAVVPVDDDDAACGESLALLVFGKRQASDTLTIDFYARTHGLTGAELGVLKAMCGGLEPKEIARLQGVAISTVRSHIGSIRMKTQTGSIRDLLGRVAVLPPITPAVKTLGGLAAFVTPHPPALPRPDRALTNDAALVF
jgi:DNA-binding CsgD family transcriptional regulator